MPPAALTSLTHSSLPPVRASPRFLNTPVRSVMTPRVIVVSVTPLSVLTPPAPPPDDALSAVLPHAASTRPAASPPASAASRLRLSIILDLLLGWGGPP